jgi:hypothetical protein
MKQNELPTVADVRLRINAGPEGTRIQQTPDGPALVRGALSVEDDDGVAHDALRPVVAVCTCGLSQRGPWCDSTHKVRRAV